MTSPSISFFQPNTSTKRKLMARISFSEAKYIGEINKRTELKQDGSFEKQKMIKLYKLLQNNCGTSNKTFDCDFFIFKGYNE